MLVAIQLKIFLNKTKLKNHASIDGGVGYTKRYLHRRYDITRKPSVDHDLVYQKIILTQKFKLIK